MSYIHYIKKSAFAVLRLTLDHQSTKHNEKSLIFLSEFYFSLMTIYRRCFKTMTTEEIHQDKPLLSHQTLKTVSLPCESRYDLQEKHRERESKVK